MSGRQGQNKRGRHSADRHDEEISNSSSTTITPEIQKIINEQVTLALRNIFSNSNSAVGLQHTEPSLPPFNLKQIIEN